MGEEDIAAVGNHAVENGHDLRERIREPCGGDVPALFDVAPVEPSCSQLSRVIVARRSVGVGPPVGASRSKPAIRGMLIILPPSRSSAAESSSASRGRSALFSSRRPTVMPTISIPARRASSSKPVAYPRPIVRRRGQKHHLYERRRFRRCGSMRPGFPCSQLFGPLIVERWLRRASIIT